MIQRRAFLFVLVLILIAAGTYFLIQIAKGYRFSITQKGFRASGLLVATSFPDGASVWVNGELKSATNTTIFLNPGQYQVEIKKDGFTDWKKQVKVTKEEVTKTDAWLFPLMPNLQSVTFTGAGNPLISPDSTKIIYQVGANQGLKSGLWIIDFADLPLGVISREPRQIARNFPGHDFAKADYLWSPDSHQVLVTFPAQYEETAAGKKSVKKTPKIVKAEENLLLDISRFTPNMELTTMLQNPPLVFIVKDQWQKEAKLKQDDRLLKLPEKLQTILAEDTTDVTYSPDQYKILYTATASATLPNDLIPQIPGSSSQPQERDIKPNQKYVYDIKEDRNFAIGESNDCTVGYLSDLRVLDGQKSPVCLLAWFPSSRHLTKISKDKVQVLEYDSTNWITVYSGPFVYPFVYANPSANKILILTNLSNLPDSRPNLYTISIR